MSATPIPRSNGKLVILVARPTLCGSWSCKIDQSKLKNFQIADHTDFLMESF